MTIQYPLLTEKAVGLIEKENKLIFIVDEVANKEEIKKAFEELYAVKIAKINIIKSVKGKKKAYIKLADPYKAADLATKLKII